MSSRTSCRYNITFISSLSTNLYIRHSLIGHLNILANVLLLGALSFHRIVLHQLGLWHDFHLSSEDSLIYQTSFIPIDIKLIRQRIIQGIYTVLRTVELTNTNAFRETDQDVLMKQTLRAPLLTSVLSDEIVARIKSEVNLSEIPIETDSDEKNSFSFRTLIENINHFYNSTIGN